MTTTPARGCKAPGIWWAYILDDGEDGRRLVVVLEDGDGNALRDELLHNLKDDQDADRALSHARWRRVEDWADTGSGQCARVARMRGGGEGRPKVYTEPRDKRHPLRLPASLHRELAAAAAEAGRSLNEEIIVRCSRP